MSSMEWEQWNQQLLGMIGRCRKQTGSRTAAVVVKECHMIVSNNPDWNKTSRAASDVTRGSINKTKVIADFINTH